VEISSSSPSAEAINSPEMNLPIQPEPSSPPRAQSPTGHAETTIPTEVGPTPHQPEVHEPPAAVSAPPSLETSALSGAPSSPVIASAQETSHEVSICTLTLLSQRLALLTQQCCFSGSVPIIIKPAIREQSSCRGDGKNTPTSARRSIVKA
jgi:hypothetical protein